MSVQTLTGGQIPNLPANLRDSTLWVSSPIRIPNPGGGNTTIRTASVKQTGLTYAFALNAQGNLDYNNVVAVRQSNGTWEPTPYASTIGTSFANSIANNQNVPVGFNNAANTTVSAALRAAGLPSNQRAVSNFLSGNNQTGGGQWDAPAVRPPGANPLQGAVGGDSDVTGTTNQVKQSLTSLSTLALSITGETAKARDGAVAGLKYPESLPEGMDYVQFSSKTYGTKNLNSATTLKPDARTNGRTEESVILPIQSSISDANTVGWNEETFNPAQVIGANLAIAGVSQGVSGFVGSLQEALEKMTNATANKNDVQKAIIAYFTEQAIGTQVLSKVSGAVFNPNTELLFQGPQLRSFSFTFKLTPRSDSESEIVKQIIGFFKRNMAPQTVKSGLYLKAPKIFEINYYFNGKKGHPGIGLIKDCALQACNVDYTPDGSYMSFEDGTMVSYNLSLQFMELEPIYATDYDDEKAAKHLIGY